MTSFDQLRCFRKDKAILILKQNHLSPQFSSSELLKFSPSLSKQINVQSKSIWIFVLYQTGLSSEFGQNQTFKADLKTILHHATIPNGLITQCSDIPVITVILGQKQFFTDRFILYYSWPFCESDSMTSSYHCSLTHFKTGFQVESEGVMIYSTCRVGLKVHLLAWKKMDPDWRIQTVLIGAGSIL